MEFLMTAVPPRLLRACRVRLAVVLALGLGLGLAGCFSLREPPCAFSCVQPPHLCPDQYTCQADGLCHRNGAVGVCTSTPPGDAGVEAAEGGDADAVDTADAAPGN
jgi:hypothetical protein